MWAVVRRGCTKAWRVVAARGQNSTSFVITLQNFAVSFQPVSPEKCCPGAWGLLYIYFFDEGEPIPYLNPDLQANLCLPPLEPLSWTTCSGGSAQNIRSLWRKTRCRCKLQWRHCFVFTLEKFDNRIIIETQWLWSHGQTSLAAGCWHVLCDRWRSGLLEIGAPGTCSSFHRQRQMRRVWGTIGHFQLNWVE